MPVACPWPTRPVGLPLLSGGRRRAEARPDLPPAPAGVAGGDDVAGARCRVGILPALNTTSSARLPVVPRVWPVPATGWLLPSVDSLGFPASGAVGAEGTLKLLKLTGSTGWVPLCWPNAACRPREFSAPALIGRASCRLACAVPGGNGSSCRSWSSASKSCHVRPSSGCVPAPSRSECGTIETGVHEPWPDPADKAPPCLAPSITSAGSMTWNETGMRTHPGGS